MKRRLWHFLLLLVVMAQPAAAAAPIVADVSTYQVNIDSGFTGSRLFLFGARNGNGDIVIVVRGPERNFIVRKKERVAGLWMNRKAMEFDQVPEFYAVASSRPLSEIGARPVFQKLGIGVERLLPLPGDIHDKASFPSFAEAFVRNQQLRRTYRPDANVQFMGETLFKATVDLPDTLPKGEYSAEIYLVDEGEVVGVQTMPLKVGKIGLDAFVADLAHERPATYGVLAVAMAILVGWTASRMFERA